MAANIEFDHVISMAAGTVADLSGAYALQKGLGGCEAPITRNTGGISSRVGVNGVDLRNNVVWRSTKEQYDGFIHEAPIGEKTYFRYPLTVRFKECGTWDVRTPVLHAALAGLDTTSAGFDDAYLRALSSLDIILRGRREETGVWTRSIVSKYVKKKFNPFRVLVRGAALWAGLAIEELKDPQPRAWASVGKRAVPMAIHSGENYGSFCRDQAADACDILFVKCEDACELYMVDVMHALCSDVFPINTSCGIRALWPNLNKPRVAYIATEKLKEIGSNITSVDVYDTMTRFCDIHDCHDLWADALEYVQSFVARPEKTGVLGGVVGIIAGLPTSNMLIGAIGPLLSGVTAEGMKTKAIPLPDTKEYLYHGAVRSVFMSASYFEALRKVADAHPVRMADGNTTVNHFRMLTTPHFGHSFIKKHVVPIAEDAGWQCFNEPLQWITPCITRRNFTQLLDHERVPWWTNVICHMEKSQKFIGEWLTPACLNEMPAPYQWYTLRSLGIVTHAQIAAALRWCNAKVRYMVLRANGTVDRMHVAQAERSRFMPVVSSRLQLGKGFAISSVQFDETIFYKHELIRKLGKCEVMTYRPTRESEETFADAKEAEPGLPLDIAGEAQLLRIPRQTVPNSPDRPIEDRGNVPDDDEDEDIIEALTTLNGLIPAPEGLEKLKEAVRNTQKSARQSVMRESLFWLLSFKAVNMLENSDLDLHKVIAGAASFIRITTHFLSEVNDPHMAGELLRERLNDMVGLMRQAQRALTNGYSTLADMKAKRKELRQQAQKASALEKGEEAKDDVDEYELLKTREEKKDVDKAVMSSSPEHVPPAEGDPAGEAQSPEDFGEPTSGHDSIPPPESALDVGGSQVPTGTLTFLPPGASPILEASSPPSESVVKPVSDAVSQTLPE